MKPILLPEEKLNDLAQRISDRLAEGHYFEQGKIGGEGLKNFAEHPQINKFLVFQVFQVWEMQISKLSHPYFDLSHPEINATIQTLKNQISRHIEVSREDFQPMLRRAVYNNLKLVLDPAASLEGFFFTQKDKIPLELYRRYAQFFSDMDFIVNSILKYYEKSGGDVVEKDVFEVKMQKVVDLFSEKSGRSFDTYRDELFQKLTGRTLASVQAEVEQEIRSRTDEIRRQEEEARRKAEEEARVKEAEARRKAEEEARRQEEEIRRQEEEARRKAEEEARKASFFDTIDATETFFDLDEDAPAPKVEQPPVVVAEEKPLPPPVVEVQPPVVVPPVPPPVVVAPPAPVEEVKPPVTEQPPVLTEEKVVAPSIVDEVMEMAESILAEEQAKVQPVEEVKDKESTTSFLERLLNNRPAAQTPVVPPVTPANGTPSTEKSSILDKINEKTSGKSLAEQLALQRQGTDGPASTVRKIKLDEIPIHKQYQFVQKVFDGNNVRFRIIVDKVNNARNKEEVEEILNKFVLSSETLNRSDAVVVEFVQLLRERY
ncbi:MAG: hypothetical protein EAZ89_17945 [Bacteroidetes bacterium]|nr:MAG: hypothetical protein EAZ89_17945 [Bacteroidota bacterium]